jgi:hypothetical protein
MRPAIRSLLLRPRASAPANPLVLDLNLTTALPSQITFARSGTRTAIIAGVLTTISSGQPAFESWDGVNRGLSIEPAFTNLAKNNNDYTQSTWSYLGASTAVAGDAGSGLVTQMSKVMATNVGNYHILRDRPAQSIAAGTRHTWACLAKLPSGNTNHSCYLRMSNEFDNSGFRVFFRLDGSEGYYPIADATMVTSGVLGYAKLADNTYKIWVVGTFVSTGNKEYILGVSANTNQDARNYTAPITDGIQVWGASITATNGPVSTVATTASTASNNPETAIFNDISWLTQAQGTFVIEHDQWSGVLIGSGVNTVLGASAPGKTAIAWDGSTSDTVYNGGSTAAGGLPTFGADIRLGSTSAAGNPVHIKSIKFYNVRKTVAELQALTAPTVVSTANPGTLRTITVDNHLPTQSLTTSGLKSHMVGRFRVKLGTNAAGQFVFDFPNFISGVGTTGNALTIDECYLERVTGVAESVQVKYGGSGTFVVPDGSNTFQADGISPSAFTSLLAANTGGMEFWCRYKLHVTSIGHKIPGARQAEDNGAYCRNYDPAAVTFSAISGTGAISVTSGSDPGQATFGYCPVLLGTFVTGDPITDFIPGDSHDEGTQTLGLTGTFMDLIHWNLGIPKIEMSKGGTSQLEMETTFAFWGIYMKYCRVMLDLLGTNNPNAILAKAKYWHAFRHTYGGDKIYQWTLVPNTTYTGAFITEAEQTITRAYPAAFPDLATTSWNTYGPSQGGIDGILTALSVRGVNTAKWIVDGSTPHYASPEGTHLNTTTTPMMVTEIQPIIAAITVS